MMPSKFKKPTVTVETFRLGAKPNPADDSDEGDEMDVSGEAEMSAFRDLRKALASQDDEKGAKALKAFLSACGAYEGEPGEPDEESE